MDQKAFLAVVAMVNSFPQSQATSPDVLLNTYKAALADVTSQAIIDAARRFTVGDVPGQSRTFAPSIAEFTQEARNQEERLSTKAKAPGRYRYTTPKSKVIERNVTKEYAWRLMDNKVHPRGCIWLPGDLYDRPEIGDLFGPDPGWQLPVKVEFTA